MEAKRPQNGGHSKFMIEHRHRTLAARRSNKVRRMLSIRIQFHKCKGSEYVYIEFSELDQHACFGR